MSLKYSFRPLGLDAGGTISVIGLNPAGDTLIMGGDVEGFARSEDGADSWRVSNRGLYTDLWHRVACIKWSSTESNTVYAGVGDPASPTIGGFLASTDGGKSWIRRSTTVQFAGNHAAAPLPDGHPRSTGNLIVQGGGAIYVATYNGGVFRSTDNGFNWTNIGFTGGSNYGRSLAMDPSDPNTLYVCFYNDKVYKTTNASAGTPSWSQLANAPANVEELVFVGSYLYGACGASGLYRTTNGGTNWDSLNGVFVDTTTSLWRAIDGYVDGSNHVIIAGCADGIVPAADGRRSLIKLVIDGVGGVTYTDISSNTSSVNLNIAPNNRTWWHAGSSYKSWLGGTSYQPTHILIDPNNHSRIWVAGTDGVFRTTNGGTNWQSAFNGMPLTLNRRVLPYPSSPLHVLAVADDWTMFDITDGIAENASTVTTQAPSNAGVGYGLAIDSVDNRVYLGVGDRDTNVQGDLFSHSATPGTNWVNEGLARLDTLTNVVTDTFTRSVSNGWGSANTGGAWTLISGVAANFNVNGTSGQIQLPAGSGSRAQFLNSVSTQNCEGAIDISWNIPPVGATHFTQVFVRSDGTATRGYTFRVEQVPGDSFITMRFHKFAGGSAIQVGPVQNVNYTAGQTLHVKFSAQGTNPTTISMKAWTGGADLEPLDWMIQATDSEATLQTSGSVGIRASGNAGYTAGALFSYDNFTLNQVGTGTGDPGTKRIIGVVTGRDGSNNRVVLAAVDTSGLWRKVGSTWTKVSSSAVAGAQSTRYAGFVWQSGSQYVYAIDRGSGLYRSSDYGVTWSQIWAFTTDTAKTGFIAQDPNAPTELWVSRSTGLFRLTNVQAGSSVGSGITSTQVSALVNAGPLTITPGGVIFCMNISTISGPAMIMRSADGGTTWNDVSDESFKAMANRPTDIAFASNGRLFVSTNSNGILVGYNVGPQIVS